MYFNKNNKHFHGIMFHHFHDDKNFKRSQGSISDIQLYKLIKKIGRNYFLTPEEFVFKLQKKKLKNTDLCLTFDDGLKSQFEIANPVLEELNLKAFYFVYTSIFNKNYSMLEPYRYFRHYYFKNINEFYKIFFKQMNNFFKCENDFKNFKIASKKKIIEWKTNHPRYSEEDILFRLTRDFFLDDEKYRKIMKLLFQKKKFDHTKIKNKLFMTSSNLKYLEKKGNLIGLHSHTHPTNLGSKNFKEQEKEYKFNYKKLKNILKYPIISASYPNGSFNKQTFKIFKKLKIKISFRQIIDKNQKKINPSNFEIARANHSMICERLNII